MSDFCIKFKRDPVTNEWRFEMNTEAGIDVKVTLPVGALASTPLVVPDKLDPAHPAYRSIPALAVAAMTPGTALSAALEERGKRVLPEVREVVASEHKRRKETDDREEDERKTRETKVGEEKATVEDLLLGSLGKKLGEQMRNMSDEQRASLVEARKIDRRAKREAEARAAVKSA